MIKNEEYYETETQKTLNRASELMNVGKSNEAIGEYLSALNIAKEYRDKDGLKSEEIWHKKVIFMACNGIGIAYAKLGKIIDAVENFNDALESAPSEEAKTSARENLSKLAGAYKMKTGARLNIL